MNKKPNILFLFPDQWRHSYLGCHEAGIPVRTPHLDAMAARGMRFNQCRTNAPLCAPARACLALGVRRRHTGVMDNRHDTDPRRTTIFNRLREAGYWTATCGKNDLHKGSNDFHNSGWADRLADYGFDAAIDQRGKANVYKAGTREPRGDGPYMRYLEKRNLLETFLEDYSRRKESPDGELSKAAWPSPLSREHYIDDFCGRCALDLLDRAPPWKPWCLWVNFPGPHGPQDAPEALFERYREVEFPPVFRGQKGLPHAQLRRLYAAACEGIDEWCGRITEAVEKRGERENTLILFASDHGEMLGDFGLWGKRVWREPSVRVPLLVEGPGIVRNAVGEALVELIDIGATLLDYAGAERTPKQEAVSFRPLLEGNATRHRDCQVSDLENWRMATDGVFKLVEEEGMEQLFDLRDDPWETANLADDKANAGILEHLREYLAAEFRDTDKS